MKLLDVYVLLDSDQITEEDAAEAFQLSLKTLRFQISRHGHRLPLILAILDQIREDKITRGEAATALRCTVRQVNMFMLTWKSPRPTKAYLFARERSQVKWELRKRFAIEYIAGNIDLLDAAEKAEVSDRQMRRWIKGILDHHFGMVWGDLRHLDAHKRQRLADEAERLEHLELRRAHTLNAIASGRRSLEEVALDRLLEKEARKRPKTRIEVRRKPRKPPEDPDEPVPEPQ
jgi:hypothetical protein